MKITTLIVIAAGLMVCSATVSGSLVRMETYTDSNGFFRYTLQSGDEPFRWGGRMQMLALRLPARRIVGIVDTPNWAWSTNDPDVIVWEYTGSNACVLDDGSVTFAYTSSYFVVTAYDDLSPTGEFPRATVVGEVYDTNRVLWTSASGDTGSVVSVNVAGYERVTFAGPTIPEAGWMAVVSAVSFRIWGRRRRK